MPSAPEPMRLAALQRWFLDRVATPRAPDDASALTDAAGAPAGPRVDEVILPSATLGAEARLAIYARMYFQRLRDIMAGEHPVVERLMGAEAFTELVRDYLHRYPPRSFALNDLSRMLPYHLAHHCAREDVALLGDVARLERAMSEAYDTPAFGRVTAEDMAAVPADAWAALRFRTDPSVRVLAFAHDALALVNAHHEGRALPDAAPRPAWAVVWRNDKVWRRSLSRPRYEILAALAAGETVSTALERASAVWSGDDADLAARVFEWFADWIREGCFSSLVVPRDA